MRLFDWAEFSRFRAERFGFRLLADGDCGGKHVQTRSSESSDNHISISEKYQDLETGPRDCFGKGILPGVFAFWASLLDGLG